VNGTFRLLDHTFVTNIAGVAELVLVRHRQ